MYLWTCHVPFQDNHGLLPVQRVVGLMDLNEDLVPQFLAHFGYMIDLFRLQGGCPCAPLIPEPIQYVMKFNFHRQAQVNDDCNQFPQHLNQVNSPILAPPLGMSTTVAHLQSGARSHVLKARRTIWTTIRHLELLGCFFHSLPLQPTIK